QAQPCTNRRGHTEQITERTGTYGHENISSSHLNRTSQNRSASREDATFSLKGRPSLQR
ncbi:unnamed protein product, partial [Penicillium egyptiacum]